MIKKPLEPLESLEPPEPPCRIRTVRFTRNKKANKYEREISNVEKQWKLTVGPSGNDTNLEIKKAAENNIRHLKALGESKN